MSHGPSSAFDPGAALAVADTSVAVDVDLVEVHRSFIVVRHRIGGQLALAYDEIAIGANAKGDAYTVIMPRVLAQAAGFCE